MFKVRWRQIAVNQLTALWSNADSAMRQEITVAVAQIDRELAHDPASKGESREGDVRILFMSPLGIRFEPNNDASEIRVLTV
jgi:hypothetical protein